MKTLNRIFSDWIELFGEVLRRLLELPALGVALVLVVLVSIGFGLALWARPAIRSGLARAWALSILGVGAICFALLIEQKLVLLQSEVRQLDSNARLTSVSGSAASDSATVGPRLFHPQQVRRGLEALFGSVEMTDGQLGEAIDTATIRIDSSSPAMIFVAVVDLTHPDVEIEITDVRGPKRTTSDFAREKQCDVAINGEAGITPMPDAPLGPWTGNWIVRGEPLLLEDSALRPFLSFDRDNRARYSVASTVDRSVSPEKFNTLWGRFDLLVGGEVVEHRNRRNTMKAPRTLMAIDATGHTLFLMVVDGRQQAYSQGLDLRDAARVLRLFGATDGMSCDEGGSSALYLRARDDLVNRPSAGFERPVYTHFGIRVQEPGAR